MSSETSSNVESFAARFTFPASLSSFESRCARFMIIGCGGPFLMLDNTGVEVSEAHIRSDMPDDGSEVEATWPDEHDLLCPSLSPTDADSTASEIYSVLKDLKDTKYVPSSSSSSSS